MIIKFVEVSNFRKLKSTRIDFDKQTTLFVGANNSGKTSAMVALRYFLLSPGLLALCDVTIANWTKIDVLGEEWETGKKSEIDIDQLLPTLDVWLDVPLSEIQHVAHMLPTLDWNGGLLGVRLKYQIKDIEKLEAEYLQQRMAVRDAVTKDSDGKKVPLVLWPKNLTDFLERRLQTHICLVAYALDPAAIVTPEQGLATPQSLPFAIPLDSAPLKNLIKIHEIAAQRDFADAGDKGANTTGAPESGTRKFKRRLSEQLRSYYDRHLDPAKKPSPHDYKALGAIQVAEHSFDERLEAGFAAALEELQDLGYPGMTNPKLKISTRLHATDGLKHRSAVQYQVADPAGDGANTLKLPEDYSGLGYQNLIAMVFMLMGFRDEWMCVGKASIAIDPEAPEQVQPLHLVLVEEPEAHLHAQVQQVFINKAYRLLRKHPELGEKTTYNTQLVVSTHSSHIAHEADFACLRYFRRRAAASRGETPTTTVVNLSHIFGEGDTTTRFVKRYLKATHCELFFADGIIFVEGQAERLLVPHFIRYHFPGLFRSYITLLELGGSHAHKFRNLVDELGLTTLIIADLDAVLATKVRSKKGTEIHPLKSVKPQVDAGQKTANQVLKKWHPAKVLIDELAALKPEDHASSKANGYALYVAYQKPVADPVAGATTQKVIPRTFEDALILENIDVLPAVRGSLTSKKINEIIKKNLSGEELEDELFELLKTAEKAAFALDCLMRKDPATLKPPQYIRLGLEWFERSIGESLASCEPEAACPCSR